MKRLTFSGLQRSIRWNVKDGFYELSFKHYLYQAPWIMLTKIYEHEGEPVFRKVIFQTSL